MITICAVPPGLRRPSGTYCRVERRGCLADKPPIVVKLIAQADVEDIGMISTLQISVSPGDRSKNSLAHLVSSKHCGPPYLDGQPPEDSDRWQCSPHVLSSCCMASSGRQSRPMGSRIRAMWKPVCAV